jgi:hypothetical protein
MPGARFQLSRFAYWRREGTQLLLESPLAAARVLLAQATGILLAWELRQPRTGAELCARIEGLTEDVAAGVLHLLDSAGIAATASDDGRLPEDRSQALVQWEFHDLLFHARTRLGSHDYPSGGTFPFLGRIEPLPAVKAPPTPGTIPLDRPDLDRLKREDLPFTAVLERRRSLRDPDDQPITARQLGEFLYRAARIRGVLAADPARSRHYETSSRPYPSGGGAYDLELYLTIDRCTDIAPAVYHYDPLEHRLCKIAEHDAQSAALLLDAQRSAAMSTNPQVLITLTSRFQRLS